jgi:hypothetical protein
VRGCLPPEYESTTRRRASNLVYYNNNNNNNNNKVKKGYTATGLGGLWVVGCSGSRIV